MKATDILTEEHGVILRVLDSLETSTTRLSAGEEVSMDFFLKAADFIKGFADGCHHKKEEGVLFEAMVANGMSREMGPVAVMLAEHEQGRQLTRGMRESAERVQAGDPKALPQVLQSAQGYVALLRQHIMKEDNVLFPMANQTIPEGQHQKIEVAFDHIEHEETGEGIHEKYLGIAEELEKMMAA